MFPSAVQKSAGVAQKAEQSCLCQPNNCRLGAATPRPSEHAGAAARADEPLRLVPMVSVRKLETAAVFVCGGGVDVISQR